MTTRGRALLAEGHAAVETVLHETFKPLTQRQIDQMGDLLARMVDHSAI